jgi:hypothetical protein
MAFARRELGSAALGVLLLLAGCGGGLRPPSGLAGAPAAPAAVERFLQLAAESDYTGMGWVFGTAEGPILERDPAGQVEQRMYAIANLLENESFVVGSGTPVPGRTGGALLFNVVLVRRGRTIEVPFTAVAGNDGRWFVEQVGVEAITDL